ncbi:MAG: L-seryl-tRNA(Sec) selenium transferase [Candidatus Marinimicrobia bacterium]|jgi:L-seryl-tRNA(Ser) seleniumtransferase|nr:L-seryl-tRNA(Sec) selenium transferase [Candidatus Neomarinimicrobiota bacterium]
MSNKLYKEIPSVQEILQELDNDLPVHKNYILKKIRSEIAKYRSLAKNNKLKLSRREIKEGITHSIKSLSESSLLNVINGTGIVLHTNFGRAPIGKKVLQNINKKLSGYVNLEVDLETGKRGDRLNHLSDLLAAITKTDGGIIVNNNAAAVLLVLNTLAEGKEVIVSRGQEVEIGGSFRIPDIVGKSNCKLVEVGTTNRTHLKDYEKAINKNTALLLWVHTSNYVVRGFTKSVTLMELAELGKRKRIPVLADLGSGALINLSDHGLPVEITVQEAVKSVVAVVTFSGDKLLGGPQSGVIVGKNSALKKIKSNTLYRALRCDKFTIALMEETLRTYKSDSVSKDNLSNVLLQTSQKTLRNRAEILFSEIKPFVIKRWKIKIIDSTVEAGSGSLPEEKIESIALEFRGQIKKLAKQLRTHTNPVVGYIHKDMYYIDLKAILPEEYPELIKAINEV